MKLLDKVRGFLREEEPEAVPAPQEAPARLKKACKKCGRTFPLDPALGYVPNFCKECKQSLAREKETKQKAGELRDIRRKCKTCGKFFTFPSDTAIYPTYCPNCRKRRQQAQKEKYARKKA